MGTKLIGVVHTARWRVVGDEEWTRLLGFRRTKAALRVGEVDLELCCEPEDADTLFGVWYDGKAVEVDVDGERVGDLVALANHEHDPQGVTVTLTVREDKR